MFRTLTAIVIFAFLSETAAAQATPALPAAEPAVLVATDQLTSRPDSTDQTTRSEPMVLLIGKTLSKFESRGKQLSDSVAAGGTAQPFTPETALLMMAKIMALPRSRFRYTVYKMPAARRVYYYEQVGMNSLRYEEPADAFTWTISPATATIAGYACQQATTSFAGRTWSAWFTREVPIAEGPYKFYGLPGLIVKVGDTRGHYLFELLKLTKPATERLVAFPTKTATTATKAAFRSAQLDFTLNFAERMAPANNGGAGVIITGQTPEQVQQKLREQTKKNNNSLELR